MVAALPRRDLRVSVLKFAKKKMHHGAALLVFDAQITKCNSSSAKNKGFFRELLRRHGEHGEAFFDSLPKRLAGRCKRYDQVENITRQLRKCAGVCGSAGHFSLSEGETSYSDLGLSG